MRIQVLVPLLIGLSACGIGSVFVYHYLTERKKRDADDSDDHPLTSVDVITCAEIAIHNDFVPTIVGKNKLSLRALEGKTGTRISFKENTLSAEHQTCVIEGTLTAIEDAKKIILLLASKPVIVTEQLDVSQSACGKILGRCGEMLQEICRKSNAKVSVNSSDAAAHQRQVVITGTRAQVNAARALIEEKIQEDMDIRKAIEESELKRERRGPLKSLSGSQTSLPDSVQSTRAEKLQNGSSSVSGGPAGGQMEVYVSAIASPSKFWLQMVGPQSTELDTLIEQMTDYYDRVENQNLHQIEEPALDQIVAAMFKWDNKWYRARIVAILPNEYNEEDMVLDIYFLDYGDSAYVAPHEVFQLRADFLTLRFQAIECFLANVAPLDYREQEEVAAATANGSNNTGGEEVTSSPQQLQRFKWDRRAVDRFEELTHVAQWEMLLCRVVCHEEKRRQEKVEQQRERSLMVGGGAREGSPVPGVELYDAANGLDVNVGHQLILEGFAVPTAYQKGSAGGLGGWRVMNGGGGGSQHSSRTLSPVGFMVGVGNGSQLATRSSEELHNKFTAICENSSNENFENASYERQQQRQ